MGITEVLRLTVEADTGGAVRGVENLGRAAEKELGRSEKSLDRWGNRLTTVGSGLVGFGSVAAAGLGKAALAASDLNETVSKSNTIFGSSAQGVERFAESAQDIGLSKQAALDAASGFGNLFTQVGLSTDSAADMSIQMTQLASDFASFHNADITEVLAAQQAAFRGEYDAVQRFVPTINAAAVQQRALADTSKDSAAALTEGEKAAATYALILEGAGSATGDFERTSDSAANKQRKLAASFDNLVASIGQGALPVLEGLVDAGTAGIGAFSGLDDATGGLLGKVATIGTVSALGVGGLSLLVGQVIKMRTTLADAAASAGNLIGRVGGLGSAAKYAAGAAGLLALAYGVGQVADAIDPLERADMSKLENSLLNLGRNGKLSGEAAKILGGNFDELGDAVERIAAPSVASQAHAVLNEITTLGGLAGRGFGGIDDAKAKIDDLDKALASLARKSPADAAAALDAITSQMERQGVPASRLTGLLDDYDAALADLDTEEATSGAEGLTGEMGDQAAATEEATSALAEYADALRAQTDPIFAAMDAINGNRDAQVAYQDALIGVQDAQAAVDEAISTHGATSSEAADAQRKLEEAQRAVTDAQWGTVTSAAEADSALAGLKDAVDRGDVSVDTFRDTLQGWVAQGFITQAQADSAAWSIGGLASQADEADKKRVDIPVDAPGASNTKGLLDRARDAALNLGAQRPNVHASASGADDVRNRLWSVRDAAFSIPSSRNIDITATITSLARGIFPSLRAEGGPVRAGEAYIVGEKRPELFIPDQDGTIMPSVPQIATPSGFAGGGAGGGGLVTNIYVDRVVSENPETFVAGLVRWSRNNGPVPIKVNG